MEAAAVIDFGMSQAAFWDLTPAQFDSFMDRHRARERRADRRAGLIASVIANVNRDTKKRPQPFTVEDFIGGQPTPATGEDFRELLDPRRAAERYINSLRAADPQAEITMSKAVLDAVANGAGEWYKLGTREGLMQPVSIIKAMNPNWRPPNG